MRSSFHLLPLVCLLAFGVRADCDWCSTQMLRQTGPVTASSSSFEWSQGEAETDKVDLLVAFDQSACAWLLANGWGNVRDFAVDALEVMNAGLANTGLDGSFSFRLAGAVEMPVDLSAVDMTKVLKMSAGTLSSSEPETSAYEAVRAARAAVKADVVVLLVNPVETKTKGASYMLDSSRLSSSGMAWLARHAYAVCAIPKALTEYTMLHEVGHVMGAGHGDRQRTSPGPQLFKYSAGYYFTAGGGHYGTVMTYDRDADDSGIEWQRLPFFSSPDYSYLLTDSQTGGLFDSGVVVGTATHNDNTRTLRETYRWVANFAVARLAEGWSGGGTDPQEPQAVNLLITRECRDGAEVVPCGGAVNLYCGVRETFSVEVDQAETSGRVMTSVKGLPSGLKFSSKTGLITGCAKKPGTFTVRITAKNRSKGKSETSFNLVVSPLPDWAQGTFDGCVLWEGATAAPVTMKVTSAGKVSGKIKANGKSLSFSATGYESAELDGSGSLRLVLSALVRKSSKDKCEIRWSVVPEAVALDDGRVFSAGRAESDGDRLWLRQNLRAVKKLAKFSFAKVGKLTLGDELKAAVGLATGDSLSFKLSSSGSVRASGKIAGKSVSATAPLIDLGADADQGGNRATCFLAFPAKRTFGGFSARVDFRYLADSRRRVCECEITSAGDAVDFSSK